MLLPQQPAVAVQLNAADIAGSACCCSLQCSHGVPSPCGVLHVCVFSCAMAVADRLAPRVCRPGDGFWSQRFVYIAEGQLKRQQHAVLLLAYLSGASL
jgi:hypothetical protein